MERCAILRKSAALGGAFLIASVVLYEPTDAAASTRNQSRNAPAGSGKAAWTDRRDSAVLISQPVLNDNGYEDHKPRDQQRVQLEKDNVKKTLDELLRGVAMGRRVGLVRTDDAWRRSGTPTDASAEESTQSTIYYIMVLFLSLVIGTGLGFLLYAVWICVFRRKPQVEVVAGPTIDVPGVSQFGLQTGLDGAVNRGTLQDVLSLSRVSRSTRAIPLDTRVMRREARADAQQESGDTRRRRASRRPKDSEQAEGKSRRARSSSRGRRREGRKKDKDLRRRHDGRPGDEPAHPKTSGSAERFNPRTLQSPGRGERTNFEQPTPPSSWTRMKSDAVSVPARHAPSLGPGSQDSPEQIHTEPHPDLTSEPGGPEMRHWPAPFPRPIEPEQNTFVAGRDLAEKEGLELDEDRESYSGAMRLQLARSSGVSRREATVKRAELFDSSDYDSDSEYSSSWGEEDCSSWDEEDEEDEEQHAYAAACEAASAATLAPEASQKPQHDTAPTTPASWVSKAGGAATSALARLPSLRSQLNSAQGFRRMSDDAEAASTEGPRESARELSEPTPRSPARRSTPTNGNGRRGSWRWSFSWIMGGGREAGTAP